MARTEWNRPESLLSLKRAPRKILLMEAKVDFFFSERAYTPSVAGGERDLYKSPGVCPVSYYY